MALDSNPNCPNSLESSNSNVRVYNKNDGTQIDRISDLPDSLICHILSFLPTKEAVTASFLSTRWLGILWSSPNLKLNFKDDQTDKTKFVNFVNGVLSNCMNMNSALRALQFSSNQVYEEYILARWISDAARLNVQSLKLKVPTFSCFRESIGACTCLTTLKLVCFTLILPDPFCLPNLKLLNLKSVTFYNEKKVANLLNGCPMLEELIMVDCGGVFAQILEICIPTLKRLRMEYCNFHYIKKQIRNYEIVLNTPGLEELYYSDFNAASRYTVKELKCLSIAHLDVKSSEEQEEEEIIVDFGVSVAELVMACSNTKYLYLSARSMLAIEYSHGLLTLFPNLKKMELGFVSPRQWGLLPHLLDCAPDLFALSVKLWFREYEWFADFDPPFADRVPDCFAKNFGKCSVLNFLGGKTEFSFVAHVLKHANYLQKMVIGFHSEVKMNHQLHFKENLLTLPRCSKKCQVVFTSHVGETRA